MILLKRLRSFAHHYLLKRKLKKSPNRHVTCNYKQSTRIAVLCDITKPEHLEPVKKYHQELRLMEKSVHLLGYIEQERPGEALYFDYMTKHNLNFFLIPSHPKAAEFMTGKYDLLINLYTEESLPLEYISALSNAAYRVGRFDSKKTHCYDLMIDIDGNPDLNFLIEQIDFYLRLIK